jgi:putative MATE family efflux protein
MESIQRQGTAPVGALLLQYSLPAIAAFLTSALYQFVDRILVGRGVGTEAMAAVTCAYPLSMLAMGVGLWLGTGTGNQVSTLLGQGRTDEAERVLGQSLRLALFAGSGLAALLIVFARPLLRLCSAEGEVLELAVPFLRIIAPGQVFLIGILSMGNVIRTQGRPGLSLSFMAGGNVINALLAALAIFGLGLGVPGAAAATAIAYVLSFSAQVLFVQSRSSHLHIRRRHLSKNPDVARSILKLGAPILFMHVVGSMVFLAANHGGALAGTHGVAAVGVFNTVSVLLIYPPLGVAQALQPLVGFNRGADKLDRVRSLLGRALLMTSVMSITSAIVVSIIPGTVASLFTRSDARLVELVREGLPAVMLSVAMVSLPLTAAHYFLAMQQARPAGVLLLGRQLLSIPLFAILPMLIGFRGLYYAPVLSDLPFALVAAVLMRREWLALGRRMREPTADPAESARMPLPDT